MAKKIVNIWYDKEGDYLEIMFNKKPGYFRETRNDRVMQKVDAQGRVLGLSILGVKESARKPMHLALNFS